MSYPQNHPQIVGFAGTGVTTPGGSNIYVFDTPQPVLLAGQNDATVPADSPLPAARPLDQSFSVPNTPNITPPPATQPASRMQGDEPDVGVPNGPGGHAMRGPALTNTSLLVNTCEMQVSTTS